MTQHLEPPSAAGRIIAIVNQKGGVGKTTTAINLGTALAARAQRVLIVDLDPQGNASTGLGIDPEARARTTYDVLCGATPMAAAIQSSGHERLDIAPATVDLSGVDVEMVDDPDRARRLRAALRAPEAAADLAAYDFVLIDCPPSLNLLTVNAMTAADSVMVPLQCEFFALEGLTQLLGTIRRVQRGLNPGLRIHGIVLTMFDRRNRLSAQVEEDVRATLGEVVYQTVIPRNVRLSEAPSHALPALVYDRDCAGSRAYRTLATEVLSRDGVTLAA
ncbi:ParA family protein [Paralimibaculum aggregatum]|uniref:ParA family protein n=1 Tax=Paralimibaculum aggregatum TaxID=3036245 RepID=A0ABQ6LSD5_9RHOB|nr:ParA family protein [Limibaculum sp. NKW23]GMG84987.1 ParA family protein [Limibaculum sp. NKW23]